MQMPRHFLESTYADAAYGNDWSGCEAHCSLCAAFVAQCRAAIPAARLVKKLERALDRDYEKRLLKGSTAEEAKGRSIEAKASRKRSAQAWFALGHGTYCRMSCASPCTTHPHQPECSCVLCKDEVK